MILGCSLALPAFALAPQAQGSQLRFSQTAAGNVVATGNALGLSKETDQNGPGTRDSVGTFICLDQNSVDDDPANAANPWFGGTTSDWEENGSEAQLAVPDRSEILYAELLWGGSTAYNLENVIAHLDDPITLSFGNDSIEVTPDGDTALTISEQSQQGFAVRYYMRSADVTEFITTHGAGTYAASGVPATQDHLINTLNAAGWTLVVAYRNSAEPIRNLTVFAGGSFVDENSSEDYEFAGFCTPPSGDFDGRIVISAIEGDANLPGDSIAIAPDDTDDEAFVTLEGPNNPANNFFASQLNDSDGNLDMSGTFGDRNHDAAAGLNVEGGRQSWDVTSVSVSSSDEHLSAGQTAAVLRTQTAGDSYVPIMAGFAIRVNSPDFTGDGTGSGADPTALMLDQTSTVTIAIENTGMVEATDLLFRAPLPEGLALDSFAVDGNAGDINGDPVDANGLESGVAVGDVGPGAAREIELVVRSVSEPTDRSGDYIIMPSWEYDYVSCVGEPPLTEPHATPPVVIEFTPEPDATTGLDDTGDSASASASDTSDSDSASAGDADASATRGDETGTGGDSDSAGQASDGGGCGCTTSEPRAPWALAFLGGIALFGRRRRFGGGAR